MAQLNMVQALNQALGDEMARDDRVELRAPEGRLFRSFPVGKAFLDAAAVVQVVQPRLEPPETMSPRVAS